MATQFESCFEFQVLRLEGLHEYTNSTLYERDLDRMLLKLLDSWVLNEILDELELAFEAFWDQLALMLDVGLYLVIDWISSRLIVDSSSYW